MSFKYSHIKCIIGMAIILSSLLLLLISERGLATEKKDCITENTVDSVMATMSVREKIAQLFIIEYDSADKPDKKAMQDYLVSKEKVGGIIIMNDIMLPAIERTNELHRLAGVPLLVTIDGEWGASMRYKEIPAFPRQMQLGALASDTLVREMGRIIGEECRDLNIHVNFAPDIDVNNNSNNPVINTRSFGEDKHKVAIYGEAYMRGMKDAGIYGSAKHFPGHGDTDVDSHKALPVLTFPYGRLDSLELYPFRHLIENGVDMVMVGHLEVHALDPSGTPASISRPIITDFLRNKLGYKGIVITDALNMKGVSQALEKRFIALEAYKAGVDILLMPEEVSDSITEIEKALERGEISMESLDEKVRKVLSLKVRSGLFDKSYNPYVDTSAIAKKIIKNSNKAFIDKLAKHTLTVIANNPLSSSACSDDVEMALPVKNLSGKKIAYLGYGAERFGKECAQMLRRYANVDTLILRGPVKKKSLTKALRRLKKYDLVLLGINNTDVRPHYNYGVDAEQMQMITDWAAKRDVIALYMGNPYGIERIAGYKNFKAVVVGYANTQANNEAAAQLVFGAVPAIGVLPVSVAGYNYGESVKIEKTIRAEIIAHTDDSTFCVKRGKIYGNHLVTAGGDTLWSDSPIDINGVLLEELIGEGLLDKENRKRLNEYVYSLGMCNTEFSVGTGQNRGKLQVISTLDDISKFLIMVLNNGIYGGEVVMPEPLRDRLMLVIYSVMMRDNGMLVGSNGLRVWANADVVDIDFKFCK